MKHFVSRAIGVFMISCLFFSSLLAQTGSKIITGVVVDESTQEPIPGATILEKGTSNGTATDLEGRFTLTLTTDTPVLNVSFIGYSNNEVTVGNASSLNISLSEDVGQLEEVVVIGYGTQKRSDITGSVASVPKDRLSNLPVTDLTQAIQGTTAGLNVSQGSSVPGSTGGLQIR
ncbi:carboxypeptidase-like regulatory domain-containing protein [Echinicola shivajiensis]|uniref:carboxypeptidase-like regulatory domain-containing protein n=1 Tax=Echinicola shivajiensis TaxID=1035916 RepID=UPI001FEC8C0A|nr:carboxypeptidase-like regulatory domain-containing protein [Echinicola shivajiensis]